MLWDGGYGKTLLPRGLQGSLVPEHVPQDEGLDGLEMLFERVWPAVRDGAERCQPVRHGVGVRRRVRRGLCRLHSQPNGGRCSASCTAAERSGRRYRLTLRFVAFLAEADGPSDAPDSGTSASTSASARSAITPST